MEMHQIRYFLAVFESRNFTNAARFCHVSQPSLTQAIKKLEEEVGGELFHRERNAVRPTHLGSLLRPRLEQIHSETQAALTDAQHFLKLEKTPLKLGVLNSIGPPFITRFFNNFRQRYPGIEIEIMTGQHDELLLGLQRGEIDVAITNPQEEELEENFRAFPLYQERYLVGLPAGHRLGRKKNIRLADLHREPYVDRLSCELRDMVMAVCGSRKIELYATYRCQREDWVQEMVRSGIGFAFLPEHSIVMEGFLCRPLVDPEITRTVTAVALASNKQQPSVEAFFTEAGIWNW